MPSTIVPSIHATGDVGDDELIKNFTAAKTEIEAVGLVKTVVLTSAQVLALNATPVTLIPARTGYTIIVDRVETYKPAGTAYAGIAAGEDITIRYTNGSGTAIVTVEATGFLDQATAQTRYDTRPVAVFTPTASAPVVAHMSTGEITTGDTTLSIRLTYREIPNTF